MRKRNFFYLSISAVAIAALLAISADRLSGQQSTGTSTSAGPLPGKARLNLVFILDGLRPDSINPDDTPNLYKLRLEGVNFLNGHSVFPTVTRVNSTAIATGTYPGTNGIVGNTMYVPKVNPNRAFNNDDYKILLKLDEVTGGNMVLAKSLGVAPRPGYEVGRRELGLERPELVAQSARPQRGWHSCQWLPRARCACCVSAEC